ncbi:MAG: hypothetical protein MI725_08915 [Pirellulales bacterium]|nr:hypothetical protein [Pirellulales bacterium]
MSQLPANAVFTLRDLNRQPAKVLEAVRKFGRAEIRTRSGEVYTLSTQPKAEGSRLPKRLPDFESRWQKMRELGHVPPTPDTNEHLDNIIAGVE